LTTFSLISALLALVGYGVAISADQFGIGYETLFSSPFELIELAPWAILHIFKQMTAVDFLKLYVELAIQMLPGFAIAFAIVILFTLCFLVSQKKEKFFKEIKRKIDKRELWILSRPTKKDSLFSLLAKVGLVISAIAASVPALFIAGFYSIMVAMAFLALIPSIGLTAGNDHIKNDVLLPAACSPPRNSTTRLASPVKNSQKQKNLATCIRVKNGKSIDERGRLVFSTSNAVILFNPDTGMAIRIPTRDAVIETVGSL
jgi:hypothetical protein